MSAFVGSPVPEYVMTTGRAHSLLRSPFTEPGDVADAEEYLEDRAAIAAGFDGFDDPAWIEYREATA